MRRLALVALLITSCATARVDDAPFRVMTYNIRLNLASDGPNAWPHRRDAVASMVRFHDPDLLSLQEAMPDQLIDLDARLDGFARFGSGRDAGGDGEHCAVYYRTSRFELLSDETSWLSPTPGVAGSKGWDAAYPRVVTHGRLRDRTTGNVIDLFNTHLDHVGVVARAESARMIADRLAAVHGPVIVTGDFNDVPASEPYAILAGAGLRDAMSASQMPHHGPTSTWNAFKAIVPARRIDFIFVRGDIEVLRHGVVAEILEDGRFPSDHLPVLAELQ
ncbi:MAG TPA: endonuclease/exonuclease/phosphatase family protein [Thermoanaerobaculia bacterium]